VFGFTLNRDSIVGVDLSGDPDAFARWNGSSETVEGDKHDVRYSGGVHDTILDSRAAPVHLVFAAMVALNTWPTTGEMR
jgi:hypothetical protein